LPLLSPCSTCSQHPCLPPPLCSSSLMGEHNSSLVLLPDTASTAASQLNNQHTTKHSLLTILCPPPRSLSQQCHSSPASLLTHSLTHSITYHHHTLPLPQRNDRSTPSMSSPA
jgi:hypothetical protein